MKRSSVLLFTLPLLALSLSRAALAHTLLMDPPPVTGDDDAKSGPCGCEFGGDPACPASYPKTVLTAGETYIVKWKETVNHTGSFRLAFATKPVDQVVGADLDANILYDETDDNNTAGATLTTTIVVPDTPCAACTLQLRQFMEGAANPYYYSCASVQILAPGGTGGAGPTGSTSTSGSGPSSGAGGAGQGGDTGEGGSTGPGLATPPPVIQTGSCSAGGEASGALWMCVTGALGIAAALRRRALVALPARRAPRKSDAR
jgi:hypothetical protein